MQFLYFKNVFAVDFALRIIFFNFNNFKRLGHLPKNVVEIQPEEFLPQQLVNLDPNQVNNSSINFYFKFKFNTFQCFMMISVTNYIEFRQDIFIELNVLSSMCLKIINLYRLLLVFPKCPIRPSFKRCSQTHDVKIRRPTVLTETLEVNTEVIWLQRLLRAFNIFESTFLFNLNLNDHVIVS